MLLNLETFLFFNFNKLLCQIGLEIADLLSLDSLVHFLYRDKSLNNDDTELALLLFVSKVLLPVAEMIEKINGIEWDKKRKGWASLLYVFISTTYTFLSRSTAWGFAFGIMVLHGSGSFGPQLSIQLKNEFILKIHWNPEMRNTF